MSSNIPVDDHADNDDPPPKRRWSALLVGFIWGVIGVIWLIALREAYAEWVGNDLQANRQIASIDNRIVDAVESVSPSLRGKCPKHLGLPLIVGSHSVLMGIAAAACHRSWRVGLSTAMWTSSPLTISTLLYWLIDLAELL